MGDKLGVANHKNDPKAELQAAVDTLNEFNKQSEGASHMLFAGLMRLVADRFSEDGQLNRKKQADTLRKAVQTLKRNYALIPKLEKGSAQEKTLASFARSVINSFNANIDKVQANDIRSVKEKVAAFFSTHLNLNEIGRIELPQDPFVHFDYSDLKSSIQSPYKAASSDKISKLPQTLSAQTSLPRQQVTHLSWQAVQLFHMKVIALIEKHQILSHLEARNSIRNAALYTALDAKQGVCIATCELSPFPGQTITVTGIFDKDPKQPFYTVPNKEHPFHLAITSTQKGFPHPCQLGWALPDIIPEYPQNLNGLPIFKDLYQSKEAISQALHPHGRLFGHAKTQLEMKRRAFNENKEMMIEAHMALSLDVAAASGSTHSADSIHLFYTRLKGVNHPYDYLTNTYQLINEIYYKRCYEKLQNAWFDGKLPENQAGQACRKILVEEGDKIRNELQLQRAKADSELAKCTIDFMVCMGENYLPWHEIILQQFSEIVSFEPPELSFYLQKIQILALKQFMAFADELSSESIDETILTRMTKDLTSDRQILKATALEELRLWQPAYQIVEELRQYYTHRD